jgi:DnaJ-class molecular chaperone
MQTAAQFVEELFLAQPKARAQPDAVATFRQRFLTPDCKYRFSDMLNQSEAEKIITVSESEGRAEVITSGCGMKDRRMRYELRAQEGNWLLNDVEWECGLCQGAGTTRKGNVCRLCKGKGWVGGTSNR